MFSIGKILLKISFEKHSMRLLFACPREIEGCVGRLDVALPEYVCDDSALIIKAPHAVHSHRAKHLAPRVLFKFVLKVNGQVTYA